MHLMRSDIAVWVFDDAGIDERRTNRGYRVVRLKRSSAVIFGDE
jgi:hypothetical protein